MATGISGLDRIGLDHLTEVGFTPKPESKDMTTQCYDCVTALTFIEWSEQEDWIDASHPEVQEAYAHIHSHEQG